MLYRGDTIKHSDPGDYGLTREEADALRVRYLKSQLTILNKERRRLLLLKLHAERNDKWLPDMFIETLDKKIKKFENESRFRRLPEEERARSIDINRIKEEVKIRTVLEIFHVPVSGKNFFALRNERTPSANFNDNNLWYDHGSGEGGSVIDLYMRLNNCNLSTAIQELGRLI